MYKAYVDLCRCETFHQPCPLALGQVTKTTNKPLEAWRLDRQSHCTSLISPQSLLSVYFKHLATKKRIILGIKKRDAVA